MINATVTKILQGHTSPDTAFVVEDYPYGYTLRCRIRYWLDVKPNHGVRLVSQTTNPKRGNDWTNKPKASTYAKFGGCMYLDDKGHVQWSGVTEYTTADEVAAWLEVFGAGNVTPKVTAAWLAAKRAYETKQAHRRALEQLEGN